MYSYFCSVYPDLEWFIILWHEFFEVFHRWFFLFIVVHWCSHCIVIFVVCVVFVVLEFYCITRGVFRSATLAECSLESTFRACLFHLIRACPGFFLNTPSRPPKGGSPLRDTFFVLTRKRWINPMTKNDILKWCDRGNHVFIIRDCLKSVKEAGDVYSLYKCDQCPASRVERI